MPGELSPRGGLVAGRPVSGLVVEAGRDKPPLELPSVDRQRLGQRPLTRGDAIASEGHRRRDLGDRVYGPRLVEVGLVLRCAWEQRRAEDRRRLDRAWARERVPVAGGRGVLRAEDEIEVDRRVLVDAVALAVEVEDAGRLPPGAEAAEHRLDEGEGLAAARRAGDEHVLVEGGPRHPERARAGELPVAPVGADDHA